MKKVLLMTLIVLMVGSFVSGAPVQAADIKPVELKIWCAWIPDHFSANPFMHIFNDMVNEKGKAVNLSIKYDREGEVTGAGGLFLQAMPGADDALAAELEELVVQFPSLGEVFTDGQEPEGVIQSVFKKYAPRFLANQRVEFMCHCGPERLRRVLKMLPADELKDIRDNGPFPLEMRCHYCNTLYHFDEQEIQNICKQLIAGSS
jgi:hypothetical protein